MDDKITATDCRMQIDLRQNRAQELTAAIMQIVGKYITNDEDRFLQKAHRELFEKLYDLGAEVITDDIRKSAGLPARDEEGWTPAELRALELARLEMLCKPLRVPVLPSTSEQAGGRDRPD